MLHFIAEILGILFVQYVSITQCKSFWKSDIAGAIITFTERCKDHFAYVLHIASYFKHLQI